jgi:hypothetical protein
LGRRLQDAVGGADQNERERSRTRKARLKAKNGKASRSNGTLFEGV